MADPVETPDKPKPGDVIPTQGGNLIMVGYDDYGKPRYQFVAQNTRTQVVNGKLINIDTGAVIADFSKEADGGVSATAIYNAAQARERDEAQRAYDREQAARTQANWLEQFGANKAQFNITQSFNEAQQKWREAVDSRDFRAAEFWKARTYELDRANLAQRAFESMRQSGPRDSIRYWYESRGMTPPRGAESVPIEDALPMWARPTAFGQVTPGDRSSVGATQAANGTTSTGAAGGTTQTPAWVPGPNVYKPQVAAQPTQVVEAGAVAPANTPVRPPVGSWVTFADGTKVLGTPGLQSVVNHGTSNYFERGGAPIVPSAPKPSAPNSFSFTTPGVPEWLKAALAGQEPGPVPSVRR